MWSRSCSSHFYGWEYWGSKGWMNLPKITQLVCRRAELESYVRVTAKPINTKVQCEESHLLHSRSCTCIKSPLNSLVSWAARADRVGPMRMMTWAMEVIFYQVCKKREELTLKWKKVPLYSLSEGTKMPKSQGKGHTQVLNCRQVQCLESPDARGQTWGQRRGDQKIRIRAPPLQTSQYG